MKLQLTILVCLIGLSAFSQPIVRNQLDTNSPPRVTQDLFNSAALYTNSGSAVYYFWTNATLGTWLGIVPGLGLVKSNAIAGIGSLLGGTNGSPNIGGMTSVGPGNGVFSNSVSIGTNQSGQAKLLVRGNPNGLSFAVNTNQFMITSGRVGIGTTPSFPLSIQSSSSTAESLQVDNRFVGSAEQILPMIGLDNNGAGWGNLGMIGASGGSGFHNGIWLGPHDGSRYAFYFSVDSYGNTSVSNSLAAAQPGLVFKTNSHIGFYAVTASNPPTSGAGIAFIFPATNAAGTAEIFTMDGAGVVKQISEHAMDAPPSLIDDIDPFPNISKEWNDYLGQVRWINRSREATVASGVIKLMANSYEAWLGIQAGANVALLANNNYWTTNRSNWAASVMGTNWYNTMKAFVLFSAAQEVVTMTETYNQYNARLGLTNGSPGFLSPRTWTGVQNQILADYANGFTNAVSNYNAAVSAGVTNAVAPVWSPPATQPVPPWLYTRGVR